MKTSFNLVLVAFVAVTGFSTPFAKSAEEKTPAVRLVEIMDFSGTAKSGAKLAFVQIMKQLESQGLPAEAMTEIEQAADEFFAKTFDDPDFPGEIAKVYVNNFTSQEIEELLAFYQTPTGKKALSTLPKVMSEGTQVGQKFAMKNQAEFQQQVQTIVEKYAKPAPDPDN